MNSSPKYTTLLILCLLGLLCLDSGAQSEPYAKIGTTIAEIVAYRTLNRIGQPKTVREYRGLYDCETLPVSRNSLTVEFDCEWYTAVLEYAKDEAEEVSDAKGK